MQRLLLAALAAFILGGCAHRTGAPVAVTEDYATFGAPTAELRPVTLAEAAANVTAEPKPVAIAARIREVCAKRGCWMTLEGESKYPVLVRFTPSENCADGFLVPRNAGSRDAIVVGMLRETEITEARARHYAEDGGASAEEIAGIVGPQKTYELMATSVLIAGRETLEPPVE